MTSEELMNWVRLMRNREKRRKIQAPNTEIGQRVEECHWSKTGWAIVEQDGRCTCVPARKPKP